MNWKSIISIIALIFAGFIAGFFTNRYLIKQKVQEVVKLRDSKGMEKRLHKILQLDENQKTTLQPIIQQHFEEVDAFRKEHHLKKEALDKKFNEAIMPKLTDVQKERLEHFQKRFKRGFKKRHKGRKKGASGKNDN